MINRIESLKFTIGGLIQNDRVDRNQGELEMLKMFARPSMWRKWRVVTQMDSKEMQRGPEIHWIWVGEKMMVEIRKKMLLTKQQKIWAPKEEMELT